MSPIPCTYTSISLGDTFQGYAFGYISTKIKGKAKENKRKGCTSCSLPHAVTVATQVVAATDSQRCVVTAGTLSWNHGQQPTPVLRG